MRSLPWGLFVLHKTVCPNCLTRILSFSPTLSLSSFSGLRYILPNSNSVTQERHFVTFCGLVPSFLIVLKQVYFSLSLYVSLSLSHFIIPYNSELIVFHTFSLHVVSTKNEFSQNQSRPYKPIGSHAILVTPVLILNVNLGWLFVDSSWCVKLGIS